MVTTPAVVANTETFAQWVTHWIAIIKAHEKLLLAIILSVVLWHFGDKAYDAYGRHLSAKQAADNSQIAQLEKQNAQTQVQLDQLKASVDVRAKIDNVKIAAAKKAVVVQQQLDAVLPLPQLSSHWQSLLSLPDGSITPQSNGTVAVTTDAAHTTVNELEKIGPLNDQLAATEDQLTGCTDVRGKQDAIIVGLNTEVTTQKKARADDAKQAKHDIHVAYFRGLKHGIGIGVAATTAVFIAIFK